MRVTAALLLTAAAVAATLTSTAGAQREQVTLRMERFYDEACRCYKFRFAGSIASGAANEYVAVVQQKCDQTFSTSIAGASTREGGAWDAVSTGSVAASATFRARWNDHLSDPVTHRADVPIWITQLGGGRVRVDVSRFDLPLKLKGRLVELQRLSAGQWTRVRRARFVVRRGTGGSSFTVAFTVRQRGLTLRAFVPAGSAAPCYAPTASKTWTSGAASPAGSDRVIDRTYLCSVAMQGGIRELSVFDFGVSSNWPDGPLVAASTESLQVNPNRCSPSRTRVPLASRGLRGGPVQSRRSFECETPSRVLVRIRGVFTAPAAFVEDRTWGYRQLVARGEVSEATLAVRAQSGKPFVFASLSASGGRLLFVARGCVDDS